MFLKNILTKIIMLLLVLIMGIPGMTANSLKPAKADGTANLPLIEQTYERAKTLADSYYQQFYNESLQFLSYYPYGTDPSTCWEYIGCISLAYKLALMDDAYESRLDNIIDGLRHYRKVGKNNVFEGYVVHRSLLKDATDSTGIAYDDNMWLGRDFVSLYDLTGDEKYMKLTIEVADFLINEGYDELPAELFAAKGWEVKDERVGSFYWDNRHDAMHTCSTGPAAQFLAAAYRITGNETYLEYAKASYNFLSYLENEYGVFHDLIGFKKDENNNILSINNPSGRYHPYNSGSPITAAIELYRVTGEQRYLDDAKHWAKSADEYFAAESNIEGLREYPENTRTWFLLILLNGYVALYEYDNSALEYIKHMHDSINYAYDNYRTAGILTINKNILPRDWLKGFNINDEYKPISLDVSAGAEIYASLSAFYAQNSITQ